MPYRQHRRQSQGKTLTMPAPQPDRALVGLRDLADWIADWPDTAHLVIAGATAALCVVAADNAAPAVQLTLSAGLFVMGARLFSRFAR